jgi:hypothetical protein
VEALEGSTVVPGVDAVVGSLAAEVVRPALAEPSSLLASLTLTTAPVSVLSAVLVQAQRRPRLANNAPDRARIQPSAAHGTRRARARQARTPVLMPGGR